MLSSEYSFWDLCQSHASVFVLHSITFKIMQAKL